MMKEEMIRKRNSLSKPHIKNTLYIHDIYQVYAWYMPYLSVLKSHFARPTCSETRGISTLYRRCSCARGWLMPIEI